MAKKIITVSVDLPIEIYDDLERQAGRGRRRVGALISRRLQKGRGTNGSARVLRPAAPSPLEKYCGIFRGGQRGSDNRRIDADLAREYAGESGKRKRR